MSRIAAALVIAASLAATSPVVLADPIQPAKIEYHAQRSENAEAKVCQLSVDFTNPPDPEAVEFAAVVGWNKPLKVIVAGFTMVVADLNPKNRNTPVKFARLATIGFSAEKFNSAGMVQKQAPDNSVWVWTSREHTMALLEAFLGGDYRIIFAREKDSTARVYRISLAPSEEVRREFSGCIAVLTPGVASRESNGGARLLRDDKPAFLLNEILPAGKSSEAALRRIMETAPSRQLGAP